MRVSVVTQLRNFLFLFLLTVAYGLSAQSTFNVSNTNDLGPGSLRQAILDANANPGADVIDMTSISGTIDLNSVLPMITESVTIDGPGETDLSISGQGMYRPFFVDAGTVILRNFSVINGYAKGSDGTGTRYGGGGGAGMGGALITNTGVDLTLEDLTFDGNTAVGGNGGGCTVFCGQTADPPGVGGAGAFFGSPAAPGGHGGFGSGGSSGQHAILTLAGTSGGDGGFGAGSGGAGIDAVSFISGVPGTPGKHGGKGAAYFVEGSGNHADAGAGGGGAGLGGALFIRAENSTLRNLTFKNNTAVRGYSPERTDLGAPFSDSEEGNGKGGAIFIYSETGNVPAYTLDGIIYEGNAADDALGVDADNADIYLETGLSFVDNTVLGIKRSIPEDGSTSYINGTNIQVWFNEIAYADGIQTPLDNSNIESKIVFREKILLTPVTFTATINLNSVSIGPTLPLDPNKEYEIIFQDIFDEDGNSPAIAPITFSRDTSEPSFTSFPDNGELLDSRTFTLTADEPIFKTDGSAISNGDLASLLSINENDGMGASIPYTATIDEETITISVDQPISDQVLHIVINNVEDLAGNERLVEQTFTLTSPAGIMLTPEPGEGGTIGKRLYAIHANEPLYDSDNTPLEDSDLASKLLVRETNMSGADVPFDAFLEGNSIYIASNALGASMTYWVSIQDMEDVTGIEIPQTTFTFNTSNLFNPVSGSGFAVNFTDGEVSTDNILLSGDLTLEAWINTTDTDGPIVGNDMAAGLIEFSVTASKLSLGDGTTTISSAASIDDGMWHHVAASLSGTSVQLYVDGVADGSGTLASNTRTINRIAKGYLAGATSELTGSLDEIRIWNTAVSSITISNQMSEALNGSHPDIANLAAYFSLDESQGIYAHDYNGDLAEGVLSGNYAWEVSGVNFPAPGLEITVDAVPVPFEGSFDFGSLGLNATSMVKMFQIENTGTVDLLLRGNPVIELRGPSAAEFTLDQTGISTELSPSGTTTFTVSFTPTVAGFREAEIVIENGTINDPYLIKLEGSGLDITTNGDWDFVGGTPGVVGGLASVATHSGDLYGVYLSPNSGNHELARLVGSEFQDIGSFGFAAHRNNLEISTGGRVFQFSTDDPNTATSVVETDLSASTSSFFSNANFSINTASAFNDETRFTMAFDGTDKAYGAYSYADDGNNMTMHGVRIAELTGGVANTFATLTRQELTSSGNGNWNIFAYDIAFDASDNLWVAARTRVSNQTELFLARYNSGLMTWQVFDLSATPGLQATTAVRLEFDANDDMHLATMGAGNTIHYIKASTAGTVLESGAYTVPNGGIASTGGGVPVPIVDMELGTDGQPIFVFAESNTSRPRALKYDNNMFNDFSEQYIVFDEVDAGASESFALTVDETTGRAYLAYSTTSVAAVSGSLYSIASTSQIVPEISVFVDSQQIESGDQLLLQSGVGFEKMITLKLENTGVTGVELSGDPIIAFTGNRVEELMFDLEGLSTSLAPGEFIEIPISFTPLEAFDETITLDIPDNTPSGSTSVSIQFSGLDPSNANGAWEEYSSVNTSIMNSIDMTIIDGRPVWAQNIFTQVNAVPNPNNGNMLENFEILELHTYDLFTTGNTTPDAVVQQFNSDYTMAADWTVQDVATDYFQKIRMVKNPTTSSASVLAGRPLENTYMSSPFDDFSGFLWLQNGGSFNFAATSSISGTGNVDAVIDDLGDLYRAQVNFHPADNYDIRLFKGTQANENEVVNLDNVTNPDTDIDLELDGNDLYLAYGSDNTLNVITALKTDNFNTSPTNILSQADVMILPSSDSRTKDLELSSAGDLWLAYIENSTGDVRVKSYDGTGSNWTDLPAIDYSAFSSNPATDVQLQIHPDGTPYVSAVVEGASAQVGIAALHRYKDGAWEQVGQTIGFSFLGSTFDGNNTSAAYNIRKAVFQLTDQGKPYWLVGDRVYTINILPDDFQQAPSFTSTPTTSVDEEVAYTYNITAYDADAGDMLTITAQDVPSWLAFVDNGDRTATLSGTPADEDVANYIITLTVTDGTLEAEQVVNLEVTNVNDDPDFFIEDITYFRDQNDLTTESINISGITDGDENVSQTLTFSVTSDNTALVNDQIVNYVPGEETATLEFTHETDMYGDANLTVRLEDDGLAFKEMVVRVNVVEGQVYLIGSNSGVLLFDENLPNGTEVATVFASDVDNDETYSFSLVSGTGDSQNDLFNIVGNSLQVAGELNFELVSTPSIRIQGDNGMGTIYERVFVLSLSDVPEAPTDFTLSATSIDEGQAIETVVGTFSATDEDDTNVHIYSLVSGFGDNASFQIVGEELQVAEVFDFDIQNSYSIQVELADNGAMLTRDFTITVNEPASGNPQTITFDPPAFVYLDETPVILEATSSSGLEVEFEVVSGSEFANVSGDNLHLVAAGTIEVAANQSGDATFDAAEEVRATIEIRPVFTISGTITDENGDPFTAGTVVSLDGTTGMGPGVSIDASGNYTFENVREGMYYIAVFPDDEDAYFVTINGDVVFWQDGTAIELDSDQTGVDIQMVAKSSENLLTGNGIITGRVIEDDGSGGRLEVGRVMNGTAIPDVPVFLIRTSDDQIMTEVRSDANGDFEITGIPVGEYRLQVEVVGTVMDLGNSTITIDDSGNPVLVTAMVGEDGITLEIEEPLAIADELEVLIYPNPFVDYVNIELKGSAELELYDLNGRLIRNQSFSESVLLQLKDLQTGVYLLNIVQEERTESLKLVKHN